LSAELTKNALLQTVFFYHIMHINNIPYVKNILLTDFLFILTSS